MNGLMELMLPAGRSAVELSFFVLLPVMVAMLAVMRLLEAWGALDRLVALLTPVLRPLGLTGLGVFAMIQVNFVNFAAPVATLTIMEQRGASNRRLAATFAMVLAMAQANAALPMAAMGLRYGPTLLSSFVGGLIAAAATYYIFGRRLSDDDHSPDQPPPHAHADGSKAVLDVINRAGAEGFRITLAALPMLIVSLMIVTGLRAAGVIDGLTGLLSPLLRWIGAEPALVPVALTKYLAGGSAMMGVVDSLTRAGALSAEQLNRFAGFFLHPLDLAGVAVLLSAGPRVAALWRPAICGAGVGILVRSLGGYGLL